MCHTPGPWNLERDRAKSLSLYGGTTYIGEVYHEQDEPRKEEDANAYLIVAAPTLVETAKAFLRSVPGDVALTVQGHKLDRAIALAEGRGTE